MLFERYTDRARRVVLLAQDEARDMGHAEIDVGHLLAALVAEGDSVAAQAMKALGIDLPCVRHALAAATSQGGTSPTGPIPFTAALKRVLENAQRESLQLGCGFIGTEHLLLGLVRDCETRADTPCTALFAGCGTRHAAVRIQVMRLLVGYAERDHAKARRRAAGDPVTERLDGIAALLEEIARHLGITVPPV